MFFDTCVYHQPGTELLAKVIPVENILFASEMIGAVRGIDPETGHYFDDTRALYRRESPGSATTDRQRIYEDNARRVYARLPAQLDRQCQAKEHHMNPAGWREFDRRLKRAQRRSTPCANSRYRY